MHFEEATINGLACRRKDDGLLMWIDADRVGWTQIQSGHVKKFSHPRMLEMDDWHPATDEEVKIWEDRYGAKPEIEMPWEKACMDSPVNAAVREKKDGKGCMVRLHNRTTYTQIGEWFYQLDETFKDFDGWEPLDIATELGRMVATFVDPPRKFQVKQVPQLRNIPDDVIEAAVSVSVVLGDVIQEYVRAGLDPTPLTEQLIYMTKNIGWLMREDRDKYATATTRRKKQASGVRPSDSTGDPVTSG